MDDLPFTSGESENLPFPSGREWFPASQCARALGYTRQHFTSLCRAGVVPGVHQTKGGHWRIAPTKAFREWFQAHPRRVVVQVEGDLKKEARGLATLRLLSREVSVMAKAQKLRKQLRQMVAARQSIERRLRT